MFTLLRIRFYPFSFRSVLPVHIAPGTFEYAMKTISVHSIRFRCSHCIFGFSKVSVFKSINFQSAFSKVSVFIAEQCERKANTDTFVSVFI